MGQKQGHELMTKNASNVSSVDNTVKSDQAEAKPVTPVTQVDKYDYTDLPDLVADPDNKKVESTPDTPVTLENETNHSAVPVVIVSVSSDTDDLPDLASDSSDTDDLPDLVSDSSDTDDLSDLASDSSDTDDLPDLASDEQKDLASDEQVNLDKTVDWNALREIYTRASTEADAWKHNINNTKNYKTLAEVLKPFCNEIKQRDLMLHFCVAVYFDSEYFGCTLTTKHWRNAFGDPCVGHVLDQSNFSYEIPPDGLVVVDHGLMTMSLMNAAHCTVYVKAYNTVKQYHANKNVMASPALYELLAPFRDIKISFAEASALDYEVFGVSHTTHWCKEYNYPEIGEECKHFTVVDKGLLTMSVKYHLEESNEHEHKHVAEDIVAEDIVAEDIVAENIVAEEIVV
jgi:hypothetical protein